MTLSRTTVDLSAYPDLVVIYLGMKALNQTGAQTFQAFGPGIAQSVAAQPDGLLLHEDIAFTSDPLPSAIFRQYWRDFASLEAWTRTMPHMEWWTTFLRDPGGTQFWHEAYFKRGGMEAIYDNMVEPVGFMRFAPNQAARGPMFAARKRLGLEGEPSGVNGANEADLYPVPE